MKKFSILILALTFIFGLCACGGGNTAEQTSQTAATTAPESDSLNIVCTIFPIYDWVKNIIGSDENITLLLDSGVDLHSYQPTADDIITIGGSDLFVYVGGESDDWVPGVLASSGTSGKSLGLMDVLSGSLHEEELVEGMQEDDDHDEEEHEDEYDEHIWLSLRNAAKSCDAICAALGDIDPENASAYNANTAAYKAKLAALDTDFADFMRGRDDETVLFGDRFPFRYFVEDYDIDYYAAFSGCSAESEASFETISFLASKVDELGLDHIFAIDGSNNGLAETIVRNAASDPEIITVNSMQSLTLTDVQSGADYADIMRDNIEAFKTALQ